MIESKDWRPAPDDHIKETNLSAVFLSQASNRWCVAISAPIQEEEEDAHGKFLGVLSMSVDVNRFVDLQASDRHCAVLVDWRAGPNKGIILQHPLFDKLIEDHGKLPSRVRNYRLSSEQLPDTKERREDYVDPLGADPEGKDYNHNWLAEMAPVGIRDGNTGWVVIVQESYQATIGRTVAKLKNSLLIRGLLAVGLIAVLSTALWVLVLRVIDDPAKKNLVMTEPRGDGRLSRQRQRYFAPGRAIPSGRSCLTSEKGQIDRARTSWRLSWRFAGNV